MLSICSIETRVIACDGSVVFKMMAKPWLRPPDSYDSAASEPTLACSATTSLCARSAAAVAALAVCNACVRLAWAPLYCSEAISAWLSSASSCAWAPAMVIVWAAWLATAGNKAAATRAAPVADRTFRSGRRARRGDGPKPTTMPRRHAKANSPPPAAADRVS